LYRDTAADMLRILSQAATIAAEHAAHLAIH
jgi:hypothetical protein